MSAASSSRIAYYDIVLQIVIRCVGTKRAVKMSYSKGIFFRCFLYQFLFPHELIADLRRLIAHKRHGDRSQKNTSKWPG